MAVHKINDFMTRIGSKGGMSMTTGYNVQFDFAKSDLSFVNNYYSSESNNKDIVNMLCDEAQLPNVQAMVSTMTGRYLGEGAIYYPHTRSYTDLSLGFLLDGDLTALKFFSAWFDDIFGESEVTNNGSFEGALGASARSSTRINRLKYMDDYASTLRIMKTEPRKTTSHEHVPVTYILENCYPYSVDAVPLAYGSSQVARCTVNFYYTRHTTSYGNFKK